MNRLLFVIIALVLGSGIARADPVRLAFVVGNDAYARLQPLANPVRDAERLSALLQRSGYRVTTVTNAGRAETLRRLEAFRTEAATVEPGSVVLIYLAGHGFEEEGVNVFAPVDASDRGDAPMRTMIPLDSFIEALPNDFGSQGILLVDACRAPPGNGTLLRTGFARQTAPANTLIGFSTAPSATAGDGAPGLGSPFANALLYWLEALPGAVPGRIMDQVQGRVVEYTGTQVPTTFSNLSTPLPLMADQGDERARRLLLAIEALYANLPDSALREAEVAARAGYVPAMEFLGEIYAHYGRGRAARRTVPFDLPRSIYWRRLAADAGSTMAGIIVSGFVLLQNGNNVTDEDRRSARALLEREAARGEPAALYNLALVLSREARLNRGAPAPPHPDAPRIVAYYERALAAGLAGAAVNIGVLYRHGEGVARDRERARQLFLLPAEAGEPLGMLHYADLTGTYGTRRRDVERDAEALGWLRRSAGLGELRAMLRLAAYMELGIAAPADRMAAVQWLERALSHYATFPQLTEQPALIREEIARVRAGTVVEEPLRPE